MSYRREECVSWPKATASSDGCTAVSVSTSATAAADLAYGVPGTYIFQAWGADVAFNLGETGLQAPTMNSTGGVPSGQSVKVEVRGDQPKIRTIASTTGKLVYWRVV